MIILQMYINGYYNSWEIARDKEEDRQSKDTEVKCKVRAEKLSTKK